MWGSGGIAPSFLTSALQGGKWSASRPCRFTPRERAPDTHRIGVCLYLRVCLEAVENRKILHCRESNPGHPASSPSLYRPMVRPETTILARTVSVYNNVSNNSVKPGGLINGRSRLPKGLRTTVWIKSKGTCRVEWEGSCEVKTEKTL
jgi:hypothetical protein